MQSIFVCNTASDSLSEINLKDYSVVNYPLDLGERPVGPHGMEYDGNNIIISNNYNNSISIFNLRDKKEINNLYVGPHPNDVKVYKNKAYVVCSESNSVVVIDLINGNLIANIPVGEYPHNIEINRERNVAYVSNMKGNSISIINCEKNIVINNIKTLENPTKISLSKDKKTLYICETYLGKDIDGCISIMSTEKLKIEKSIRVGAVPVDFQEDKNKLYVTNLNDGTISIIDIVKGREIKKIYLGGCPKGIIKYNEDIFVGDYMNGKVFKINLKERIIKTITVGIEPNAMILV